LILREEGKLLHKEEEIIIGKFSGESREGERERGFLSNVAALEVEMGKVRLNFRDIT
jgi:hypothetical protein